MRTSTVKAVAALALTGAGSALVLGFQTTDAPSNGPGDSSTAAAAGSGANGSTTTTKPGATTGPRPTSSTSGTGTGSGGGTGTTAAYSDGTWTGKTVDEPWGPFQVQVVVANGSIATISVVESPSDRRSTRINSRAVPMLTASVMASHGTQVDMVSGATWTSDSYATSLQSALDQAAKG